MSTENLNKRIGIWLDHTKAHFIDLSKGITVVETVHSDKESEVRFKGETGNGISLGNNRSTNNENHVHNRQQQIIQGYYQILSDRIKNYDDILLFGPTGAKDELYNKLSADKHFANKVIRVESADKLTENQMVAQVKQFFNV